ncbi:hypothetical protein, partial [Paraburkholderia sp. C35]|uniref:hypothetical protein n=1 Tax=Paraburkholderia sp. C35 TaxID=2126993 RepID=UPI00194E0F41
PLSFAYFSLRRQRKVGAAPHRGNTSKPLTKSGRQRQAKSNPHSTSKTNRPKPTQKGPAAQRGKKKRMHRGAHACEVADTTPTRRRQGNQTKKLSA